VNTRYVPTQALCNTPQSSTTPCCKADFNKANGINVQDIYDFLNAWLAQDPSADYVNNGAGAPTQASVNAFISAWFAGGCS
jgi:hypothetical protein